MNGVDILRQQVEQTQQEIALLEEDVRRDGTTIKGARGQIIAHPALAALARLRRTLADMLGRLGELPSESQSQKASRAARERWKRSRASVDPGDRVYVPSRSH